MIEVEQKFILSEKDIEKLIDGADFLSEKTFTDVYCDSADFSLSRNDMWLRRRGENWELKIPMHEIGKSVTMQYQEIEGEEKIREIFGIVPILDFETDIRELGYESFCKLTTTRRKYKKDGFIIDLDEVSGENDFAYKIGEIELMVESKDQMQGAIHEIANFAKKHFLETLPVRGKVLEYLQRKKPRHFEALMEAGVVTTLQ